jgi:molybdenum cofactor cytidylyltransferase
MQLAKGLCLVKPGFFAFVGAGGKTTAIFKLARQLSAPVIITTTTHLGADQVTLADRHLMVGPRKQAHDLSEVMLAADGVIVVTGPATSDNRLTAPDRDTLDWLARYTANHQIPFLVEADGSRRLPVKAPGLHEPVIPGWVDEVVVVTGLSGLGKPLTKDWVHRPECFEALSGLRSDETITTEALARVLVAGEGGLKGIPAGIPRVALLNQADNAVIQSQGRRLAELLVSVYDRVLLACLEPQKAEGKFQLQSVEAFPEVIAAFTPVAGIILAAGDATRMGMLKQLLIWKGDPFIRHVAKTALKAGLSPVTVVLGAESERIQQALEGLPVQIVNNPEWQNGQSTSIRAGVQSLPRNTGATVFMLADQPQIPETLVTSLVGLHQQSLAPIVAPQAGGRRGNPVLFDRTAFADLLALQGDTGGRAVFSRYPVTWLPWQDDSILLDIDTPEDYIQLINSDL